MGALPPGAEDGAFDATFGLELNEWKGTVEPRLVLRQAIPCAPGPVELAGEPEDHVGSALAEMAADPRHADFGSHTDPKSEADRVRDRRGVGIAGTLTALVATGEPVLVVCADARARRKALAD